MVKPSKSMLKVMENEVKCSPFDLHENAKQGFENLKKAFTTASMFRISNP